nr:immunoglobulin light chain junction region [Macaca mulatta]
CMQDLELPWTF